MQLLPDFAYCHQIKPNPLETDLLNLVARHAQELESIRDQRYTRSQDIEQLLSSDLAALGFLRSVTVDQVPELFWRDSDFEVDFYHPTLRVAIEVEKGKHFNLWRNVIKFCESPLIDHAVLIIPYSKKGPKGMELVYSNSLAGLRNVHNLYEHMMSLLCVGY